MGVGIKTFITNNASIGKSEKVAEFNRQAALGVFDGLDHYGRAMKSAELRNIRVISDANEYSIDIAKSIYHCLIRTNKGALIHEEPYELININCIKPTDKGGKEIKKFSTDPTGSTHFTDGITNYRFDRSKNVLFKTFRLTEFNNSNIIKLDIYDDILQRVLSWTNLEITLPSKQYLNNKIILPDNYLNIVPEEKFIILPLYGTSYKHKEVQPQSGINQWNAGGRKRKFGEAYIPIPSVIHKKYRGFLPPKDKKFKIKLPSGNIILAKICQQNSKALMSDPNTDLCDWLYKILDLNQAISHKRFIDKRPYTYQDLLNVGKDSVKLTKSTKKDYDFKLETTDLGAYEDFINENDENDEN